jgi:hypothetical protein
LDSVNGEAPGAHGKHWGKGKSFGAAVPATTANVTARAVIAISFFMIKVSKSV